MKHKAGKNVIIALVLIFLYLPIMILVIYSFNTSKMNVIFFLILLSKEDITFLWEIIVSIHDNSLSPLDHTLTGS